MQVLEIAVAFKLAEIAQTKRCGALLIPFSRGASVRQPFDAMA